MKQNGATGLTKALSGARLALLQSRPWLPRAAFGKALDAAWAAFHMKCLLAVLSLRHESRPVWNKLFSSPSQFSPNEYFLIRLQHLSQPWTLWRGSPFISCPGPGEMVFWYPSHVHIRHPGLCSLFSPSHLSPTLIWCSSNC